MSRIARLGWPVAIVLMALGCFWAFQPGGGNDFGVFHYAWNWVLKGNSKELYGMSPDRYLYAPGFAWLLAPLGLFPKPIALGIWCAAKIAAMIGLIRLIAKRFEISTSLAALAMVLIARPFLIEFKYGQVNSLILAAAVWAMHRHTRPVKTESSREGVLDFISWLLMTWAATAKLFPLPILLVPFLVTQEKPAQRLRSERVGILVGALILMILPLVSVSWGHLTWLYDKWVYAILDKGFPTESHNQSFSAAIHRYLSGEPVHIISFGVEPVKIGWKLLSASWLKALSYGWTLISAGILLAWILFKERASSSRWIAMVCALLIVPLHLVWKPYFIFAYPLAALAFSIAVSTGRWIGLLLIFAMINLTTFDVIGNAAAGRIESASILLAAHLFLMIWVSRFSRSTSQQ